MPAKKHDISAADFRDPLLKVLGQLSGFKAGAVVHHTNIYEPVFQMMGITQDQYGMEGSSNSPLTERWVQWCASKLISEKLVRREGKGKWSLTRTGVAETEALIEASSKVGTTMNLDTATTTVDLNTALAAPLTPTSPEPVPDTAGQSIQLGPNNDENLYHSDPYIRSLAIVDSPCLGGFTDHSPVCTGCLVRGNCLKAMAAIFSRLAAKLTEEDLEEEAKRLAAEAAARRLAATPKAPVTAPGSAATTPGVPRPAAPPKGVLGASGTPSIVITSDAKTSFCAAAMEAPCQYCGKDIKVGTQSAWVRKLGPDKKSSAMLHKECYDELVGAK